MRAHRFARPLGASSAALLLCSALAAQQRWIEPVAHLRQSVSGPYLGVAHADLDGDGALDLVWSANASERLQMNQGRGLFADPDTTRLPGSSETAKLLWFDADGDSDLDLLRARGRNTLALSQLYWNDASGRFAVVTAGRLTAIPTVIYDAIEGDVDGDTDLDLAVATNDGMMLWTNDGTGRFTDVSATQLPQLQIFAAELVLGDFDRDGDLDLTLANTVGLWSIGTLWRNDGTGTFSEVTASQYHSPFSAQSRAIAVGDLDGDLDPDLALLGNYTFQILSNDGAGGFDPDPRLSMPPFVSLAKDVLFEDLDGDSDLDLFFLYSNRTCALWRNDGALRFTDVSSSLVLPIRAWTAAQFADFDGDGDRDLTLAAQLGRSEIYERVGPLQFTPVTRHGFPDSTGGGQALATGDVDGDGDADVVNGGLELARNDGKGRFASERFGDVAYLVFGTSVALGDIDRDGDLDVLAGFTSGLQPPATRLFQNDGAGHFAEITATHLRFAPRIASEVLFADVDLDGDPDILQANSGTESFFRNDGTGHFQDDSSALPPNAAGTSAIRAGDLDGDGDLDLAASDTNAIRVYLGNAGASSFVDASAGIPALANIAGLALADVEGDSDLDLFVSTLSAGVALLLNDGSAGFSLAPPGSMPASTQRADRLLAHDFDRDGDVDLLVTRFERAHRTQLFTNDGAGRFTDASALLPRDEGMSGLAALDADSDGDLEILVGTFSDGVRYYKDSARELHLVLPPHLGSDVAFDLYAKPSFAPGVTFAALMVAPAEGRVPIPPIGTLGLDPATLFVFATLAIPAPGGRTTLRFALPPDPLLAGAFVATQAFSVDPFEARYTNVQVASIR